MANFSRALDIVKEQLGAYSGCSINEEQFTANLKAFLQSQFVENDQQSDNNTGQNNVSDDDDIPVYSGNEIVENVELNSHEILTVDTGNHIALKAHSTA